MADQSQAGVFYADNDYLGIVRRSVIMLVDFIVLGITLILEMGSAIYSEFMLEWGLLIFIAFCYLYLALLKTTRWRTVGYRVTGARLVDLKGHSASIWRASFRFLFLALGPLNLLIDLIWLSGDIDRQGLRDKFAGTYVVRDKAFPMGNGAIRLKTYFFLGNALMFQEVARPAVPARQSESSVNSTQL